MTFKHTLMTFSTLDHLFEALNNYQPNMKFTIETNPNKFLDTEIIGIKKGIVLQMSFKNRTNTQINMILRFQTVINVIPLRLSYIALRKLPPTLN